MPEYEIRVEDLSGTGPEENVTTAASNVEGVERAVADREDGILRVKEEEGANTEADVRRAINEVGFETS